MVPLIRLSATSDLKEFDGRDLDEDRARSWVTTVKTAFTRDQAPDSKKCLVFRGLLIGPAQNWLTLSGSLLRENWKDLLKNSGCSCVVWGTSCPPVLPREEEVRRVPFGLPIPPERDCSQGEAEDQEWITQDPEETRRALHRDCRRHRVGRPIDDASWQMWKN